MKQWVVDGRFTFDGHALVEAESLEAAKAKFESGNFEFDFSTGSVTDWEARRSEEDK